MISSMIRKLLWSLGYPKLETSSGLVGPYHHVGVIQVRIPESTACQIFYPAQEPSQETTATTTTTKRRKKKTKESTDPSLVPYFRLAAVEGLIDFLRSGDGLLQLLSETPHPCHWQAEPLFPSSTTTTTPSTTATTTMSTTTTHEFPLVIVSHGLAGTFEMYTELCQQMASLGYCVVALEHEDGSAAYAQTVDGTVLPYQRPNDSEPYSRQKVWTMRTPMLHQRVQEMEKVVQYFHQQKTTARPSPSLTTAGRSFSLSSTAVTTTSTNLLDSVIQATDPSQLHLVGHSFGAATQILAAHQWTTSPSSSRLLQPKSLMALDAWAFALQEHVIQQGLVLSPRQPHDDDYSHQPFPLLSIISEDWITNPETTQIVQFLQNTTRNYQEHQNNDRNNLVFSYYAANSVHQSFSDTEAWFPSFIAKRVENRGPKESRHVTIRAAVQAWKQILATTSTTATATATTMDGILKPFPIVEMDDNEQNRQANNERPKKILEQATTISTTATAPIARTTSSISS
jgi:pimeloyl-ACP methyl ester carboxylesterase